LHTCEGAVEAAKGEVQLMLAFRVTLLPFEVNEELDSKSAELINHLGLKKRSRLELLI